MKSRDTKTNDLIVRNHHNAEKLTNFSVKSQKTSLSSSGIRYLDRFYQYMYQYEYIQVPVLVFKDENLLSSHL